MNVALILAGGTGSRVGSDRPKQFVEILGKPVLAYTIEIYQNNPDVAAIEVVCHAEWLEYLEEMIQRYKLDKVRWTVRGGETFQDSVINGINNLKDKISNEDIVLIHYGAAPFTSDKIISDSIRVCEEHGMSAACTPCYQLMGSNDFGVSRTWVDRDKFIQITCPQCFKFSYILNIYERAEEQGILDKIEPHTTSLMFALGEPVYQSYSDQTNIKITTKEDLDMFEGYELMRQNHRLSNENRFAKGTDD